MRQTCKSVAINIKEGLFVKTLKRISRIFIVVLFSMSLFVSCISGKKRYVYDLEDLGKRVVSVELLHLHDGEAMSDYDQLYILQEDEIFEFLQEYCELSFAKFVPPKRPSGYAVMLIYKDGCYDVVSANGGTQFDARGEKIGHAPTIETREAYLQLLSKYIEVNVENRYW